MPAEGCSTDADDADCQDVDVDCGTSATAVACESHPARMRRTCCASCAVAVRPLLSDSDAGLSLRLAIFFGGIADVRAALMNGASPDALAPNGWTLLQMASSIGRVQAVRLFLSHASTVDAVGELGATALHIASQHGSHAVVDELLRSSAAVGAVDRNGLTPLALALQQGHLEVATLLAAHGALTEDVASKELQLAVAERDAEAVRWLLARGADPNATGDAQQQTPLMRAALNGHAPTTQLLLEADAEVERCTSVGLTALMAACQGGHEAVLRLLLEAGARVDREALDGTTALHVAASRGCDACVRRLLRHGAGVDPPPNGPQQGAPSALMSASASGQRACAEVLLAARADVNYAAADGQTALHQVSRRGHSSLARVLLAHGADASALTAYGASAADLARWHGHRDVAAALQVDDGRLAFAAACERSNVTPALARRGGVASTFVHAVSSFAAYSPRVLSRDPWLVQFDSFVSADEAHRLVALCEGRFRRSSTTDRRGNASERTSRTCWCEHSARCAHDPLVRQLSQRVADVTRTAVSNAEHFQVLRY